MKKCNAVPYEGNEPYIFVSYSHNDSGMVYPVIEYLAKAGYRIWYDNGIHPGTEWPEVIADHLEGCTIFLPFISSRSLSSHNCKNEFNYAFMENKPALSVVLESVEMSNVMKMQMATVQGILRYEYEDWTSFIKRFDEADILDICKGKPDPDIVISDEIPYEDKKKVQQKDRIKWFDVKTDTDINIEADTDDDEDEVTIMQEDDDLTVEARPCYILIRDNTNEKIKIDHSDYVIGRASKNTSADYSVKDPNKMVSRNHMSFVIKDNVLYVRDNGTTNGTFVNGKQIAENVEVELKIDDVVTMAYDEFTFRVSK